MTFRVITFSLCAILSQPLTSAFGAVAEEAVTIKLTDGVVVSGQWTLPEKTPKAVLVIIQGSGNVGSDGDVSSPFVGFGYKGAPAKLSEQLALVFASQGVATLRYAKRGFEEAAQLPNQTISYLIQDAKSVLAVARARFPAIKSGYLGFSEGAVVAVHVAAEQAVDALFLLGLPGRAIDDIFAYQFVEWPLKILKKLDANADAELSAVELAVLGKDAKLPLLGPAVSGLTWTEVDADKNGRLSFAEEIVPAYQAQYRYVLSLMQTPGFLSWYKGMKALAPLALVAPKVAAPIFLYHALEDAQVQWSWVVADQRLFAGKVELRLLPDLGHCFAPMDGVLGEVKTSGPLAPELLEQLALDVNKAF